MVHCGYDPSGALGTNYQSGDNWKNFKYNFGAKPKPYSGVAGTGEGAFNGVSIGKGHLAEAKAAINSPAAGARGAFRERSSSRSACRQSCGTTIRERDELLAKIEDAKNSDVQPESIFRIAMSRTLSFRLRVLTVSTAAPARAIRRGAKSPRFWYPTWLAQPAALVPDSGCWIARRTTSMSRNASTIAKDYDHVIINTSTPSLKNDCKVAEAIKAQKPGTKIGFVGAHAAVLPTETLEGVAGH